MTTVSRALDSWPQP